jgi:AraC-like DNA-binding protein
VAGFEYLPEGQLLAQFVDFRHSVAAAYERCVGYTKDFHTHDRVNLTFPRSSSIIKFGTRKPVGTFLVDETKFLWMPENVIHRQDTVSTIYDNLAIFPSPEALKEATRSFAEKYGKSIQPPKETLLKRRTLLLDALLQEYFSERVLERRKARLLDNLAFQILEEIFRILFCPKRGSTAAGSVERQAPTERAVRFIESNLFGELSSRLIAGAAGVSIATLFRKFQQDLGMSPREYIFRRRMDEARALLMRGDHRVSDVALLVGYQESAAFSKAFKSHFGMSPVSFLKSRP